MREYHIYEDNGCWYHMAVVEDGKCILWIATDLQTAIDTRNDLASGECELCDIQGQEPDPQSCWSTMQHLLDVCAECRELDV